MNTHPVKRKPEVPSTVDDRSSEVARSTEAGDSGFTFRYSYTEVSAAGSKTRLKSKRVRYEDGKLSTESFEGEVGRDLYERMITETQRLFLRQTALFLQALGGFRTQRGKHGHDRE